MRKGNAEFSQTIIRRIFPYLLLSNSKSHRVTIMNVKPPEIKMAKSPISGGFEKIAALKINPIAINNMAIRKRMFSRKKSKSNKVSN